MSDIVPFGKYVGQPVEAMAQDTSYCKWLSEQDWFRTKYSKIHTLIINNFAAPSETPEHNALQALFIDLAWTEKFMWTILTNGSWWERLIEMKIKDTHEVCDERIRRGQQPELKAQRDARITWLESGIYPMMKISDLTFERRGVDVEFVARVGITEKQSPAGVCFDVGSFWLGPPFEIFHMYVECKPTLGDDYPAVLRQIGAHKHDSSEDEDWLLIGQGGYTGTGATFSQVKKIFKASKIDVMLLSDVGVLEGDSD